MEDIGDAKTVMTSCRYGSVLYQSKMKIKNWVLLAYCFTERHRTHASTVNEASLPQEGYVDRTLSTRTILRWFRYFRMLCRDDFKKNKSKIGGEGSILEGDESLFGQRSCKIVHNIDHSFSLLFIFQKSLRIINNIDNYVQKNENLSCWQDEIWKRC